MLNSCKSIKTPSLLFLTEISEGDYRRNYENVGDFFRSGVEKIPQVAKLWLQTSRENFHIHGTEKQNKGSLCRNAMQSIEWKIIVDHLELSGVKSNFS